ncbi:MAG: hypothetical protein JWN00_2555 [Actinomycetia bacterium]|nr:hypothetical protein [Actinomycetes bacterium]
MPGLIRPLDHISGWISTRCWRASSPRGEFEGAEVNLGALEAKPYDLARLGLVEFALVYGQDWLVIPLDVPVGSLTVIETLSYTTTFNETITVPRAADGFQLFEIDRLAGLLVPPATLGALEGRTLEEVHLLRDEAANLAWAVEQTVRAPSGTPRSRGTRRGHEPSGLRLSHPQNLTTDGWDTLIVSVTPIRDLQVRPLTPGRRAAASFHRSAVRFGL